MCAGPSGNWKSKSKVMDIEEQSGIATAQAIGHATLIYMFSTSTSTNTEVSGQIQWDACFSVLKLIF